MDIIRFIQEEHLQNIKHPLLIVVHHLISKSNESESTKILSKDSDEMLNLARNFYSTLDNNKKREFQRKIADILSIYSNGENFICDIETELSRITMI